MFAEGQGPMNNKMHEFIGQNGSLKIRYKRMNMCNATGSRK